MPACPPRRAPDITRPHRRAPLPFFPRPAERLGDVLAANAPQLRLDDLVVTVRLGKPWTAKPRGRVQKARGKGKGGKKGKKGSRRRTAGGGGDEEEDEEESDWLSPAGVLRLAATALAAAPSLKLRFGAPSYPASEEIKRAQQKQQQSAGAGAEKDAEDGAALLGATAEDRLQIGHPDTMTSFYLCMQDVMRAAAPGVELSGGDGATGDEATDSVELNGPGMDTRGPTVMVNGGQVMFFSSMGGFGF